MAIALKDQITQAGMFAGVLANPLGSIYFVDSVNGRDGNDGLSARHPLLTLTRALALAAAGDTIVCLPGGSETVTATLAVSVARLKIVCPGGSPANGFTISGAGTLALMTVSAADVEVSGLKFAHTGSTASAQCILTTNAADRLVVRDCLFDDSAIVTTFTGAGVEIVNACDDVVVERCVFKDCKFGVKFTIATGVVCARPKLAGNTYFVGKSAAFGIATALTGTGAVRGIQILGERFIEANGDGSAATVAWDGSDGTNGTQGPIKLEAAVDQGLIADCRAYSALTTTTFANMLTIASGAAVGLVGNESATGGNLSAITDALHGSAGIASFPAAAAAANGVSIAEVLRYLSEKQLPRLVTKQTGSMASGYGTADSPKTMFTVTGQVLITGFAGIVTTPLTSTGGTGTIALGTADQTGFIVAATTADGTEFGTAGDVWVDTSPRDNIDVVARSGAGIVIGGGADIIMTIATNNMTAGALDLHIWYIPLSSDGAIVAA